MQGLQRPPENTGRPGFSAAASGIQRRLVCWLEADDELGAAGVSTQINHRCAFIGNLVQECGAQISSMDCAHLPSRMSLELTRAPLKKRTAASATIYFEISHFAIRFVM